MTMKFQNFLKTSQSSKQLGIISLNQEYFKRILFFL